MFATAAGVGVGDGDGDGDGDRSAEGSRVPLDAPCVLLRLLLLLLEYDASLVSLTA